MDRIDRAISKAFREQPRARRVAERYGLARFRRRTHQHIGAGEMRIVCMYDEPEPVQRAMAAVALALDYDGSRQWRRTMPTYVEERRLFAEGFRGQPLRQDARISGEVNP